MTNWRNIGDAPGLSGPPDPPPTILDDRNAVEELIAEQLGTDNSTVVEVLADLLIRNFSAVALVDAGRVLEKHMTPWIEEADKPIVDDIEPDEDD